MIDDWPSWPFKIACRVTCLSAVVLVAIIVVTSVGESWDLMIPLIVGFSIAAACLLCLPMPRGAMLCIILLPWSTIIGSNKIHFPLAASVLVFEEMGSMPLMLCLYSVVLSANLLCLWNAFAPTGKLFSRPVIWVAMAVAMLAIGTIHTGPSWLIIAMTVGLVLCLLDSRESSEYGCNR